MKTITKPSAKEVQKILDRIKAKRQKKTPTQVEVMNLIQNLRHDMKGEK